MSRPGPASRRRADASLACPECGRAITAREDGQRRRHRVDDSNPVSAYCVAGAA